MSWNYRVLRFIEPDGTRVFAIHEVYYGASGAPKGWTEFAAHPQGETFKALTQDFTKYQEAFQRHVLAVDGELLVDIGPMGNSPTPPTQSEHGKAR